MLEIINVLKVHIKHIESIYLIGSHGNETNKYDSDIDLVVITQTKIDYKFITAVKKRFPFLDITLLDKSKIEMGRLESPSIYISAIHQIQLKPNLLFGSHMVEGLKLPIEHVIYNQLHFTLYASKNLFKQNAYHLKGKHQLLPQRDEFVNFELGRQFTYRGKIYYSYRLLYTLLLTISAYKLIKNDLFSFTKPGKHWFILDYLNLCADDPHYDFIKHFYEFFNKMGSNVFDRKSDYVESKQFKSTLYLILEEYFFYLNRQKQLKCAWNDEKD